MKNFKSLAEAEARHVELMTQHSAITEVLSGFRVHGGGGHEYQAVNKHKKERAKVVRRLNAVLCELREIKLWKRQHWEANRIKEFMIEEEAQKLLVCSKQIIGQVLMTGKVPELKEELIQILDSLTQYLTENPTKDSLQKSGMI